MADKTAAATTAADKTSTDTAVDKTAATAADTADTTTADKTAAAATADTAAAGDKAAATTEKSFTQADLDRELAKQKKELAKDAEKAAAQAKLTEDERKDAQLKDLQTQIRMRDAKDEVLAALEKEGSQSKGLMWEAVKGQLEFDDKTGKLTNLKDVIAALKADYADSFGTPKPKEGIEGGAGQQVAGDPLTKEKLAAMSSADIAKLPWEDVKKAMSA